MTSAAIPSAMLTHKRPMIEQTSAISAGDAGPRGRRPVAGRGLVGKHGTVGVGRRLRWDNRIRLGLVGRNRHSRTISALCRRYRRYVSSPNGSWLPLLSAGPSSPGLPIFSNDPSNPPRRKPLLNDGMIPDGATRLVPATHCPDQRAPDTDPHRSPHRKDPLPLGASR